MQPSQVMKSKVYSLIILVPVMLVQAIALGQSPGVGPGWQYQGTKNGVDYFSIKSTPPAAQPYIQQAPQSQPDRGTSSDYAGIPDYNTPTRYSEDIVFNNKNGRPSHVIVEQGLAYNSIGSLAHGFKKEGLLNNEGAMTLNRSGSLNGLWFGTWKKGEMTGQGRLLASNYTYEGEFKDWKMNGHGKLVSGKYVSEGEWIEGHMEGQGTTTYDDTAIWAGEMKAGVFNGHGSYKTPTMWCEGEWKNGQLDGHGIYKYADGSKYEGGFKDGTWFGEGVATTEKGTIITANWTGKWNPRNCKYKEAYPNGKTKMECTYVDTLREGVAKGYYESGAMYWEATFKRDILEGRCKQYYESGELDFFQNYKNGRREGEVTEYYKNGKVYQEWNYKDGVEDGDYRSYYPNGMLWSSYIYKEGKIWNTITDNMPDGLPTGTNVKDGNGVTMGQSPDGKVIISKTTYENGVAVKTEKIPAK